MTTHTSMLAGEFHGQRSLLHNSTWGPKELDMNAHKQLKSNIIELPLATDLLSLQFLLIEG